MKRTAKTLILFSIGFLLMSASYMGSLEAKEANLMFKGDYFSADLNDISVDAIFRTLEREKGIWCTGNQSLLEKKVTVRFTNHSLEDGIRRILASMNYCLVFESDGRLAGAVLIGKGKHSTASIIASRGAREKTLPSRMKNKNVTPRIAFETAALNNGSPPGRVIKGSKSKLKDFKILTNAPQPQSALPQMTPERQREILKVLRDQPPQDTPAAMTPEQIATMRALIDRPPPVNANANPIDTTVIKNHPPPGR